MTTVAALFFPLKRPRAMMLIAFTPPLAQDVYLNLAPLFHIGGLSYALAATLAGAVHVFPEASAAFAPARRLSDITAYGVTVFIAGELTLRSARAQHRRTASAVVGGTQR